MNHELSQLYRTHREKILFLIVGGWNTAVQYGVFSLCWYLLGTRLHSIPILLISYLVASVNGFLSFRYIVFKPVYHPLMEYLRYQVVYLPLLVLNLIGLPLILRHTRANAYLAQASFIIIGIVVSYVGNKYFTFRKPSQRERRCMGTMATRSEGTRSSTYTDGLLASSDVRWKKLLDVQRPYRWNLRRIALGRTLDVGCGIGRNMGALDRGSLGVDHNAHSVDIARSRGFNAITVDDFQKSVRRDTAGSFDSMLLAHVLEHMSIQAGRRLIEEYLPYVDDKVVVICPQEKGFSRDDTHVTFLKREDIKGLLTGLGLRITRAYCFPFPAAVGKLFAYNETVVIATKRSD